MISEAKLLTDSSAPLNVWHILLVEDNRIAAKVAQCILQSLRCYVDIALNAEAALLLIKEQQYNLIFMDIGLPELDGFRLTELIRHTLAPAQQAIPVIALSAHADISQRQEFHAVGMKGAIVKPLTREKAMAVLQTLSSDQVSPERVEPEVLKSDVVAVLDMAAMQRYISPDKAIWLPLLREFLAGLTLQRQDLNTAFERQDWLAVAALIHKLKGACGYYGANQLAAACVPLLHLTVDSQAASLVPAWICLQQALDGLAAYDVSGQC